MISIFKKRVPEIYQIEVAECGAASLCMILGYYGRYVPLSTLRKECKISRDGSKLSNIKEVAISYGLDASAKRATDEYLEKELHFPIIVLWNFNHFLVVEKLEKKYAYLCDPDSGRRKISRAEFNQCYSGIALQLIPNDKFEKGGKPFSTIKYLLDLVFEKKDAIISLSIITLVINLFCLTGTILISYFIDFQMIYMGSVNLTKGYIFYLIFVIIQIPLIMLKNSIIIRYDRIESATITQKVMSKILKLPLSFYSLRNHSSLVSRLESIETLSTFIANKIAPVSIGVIFSLMYVIIICKTSMILGLTIIIINIIFLLIFEYMIVVCKNASSKVVNQSIMLFCSTTQTLKLFDTVKSSAMEDDVMIETSNCYNEYANANQYIKKCFSVIQSFPLVAPLILNLIVVLIGCYLYSKGSITIGSILICQSFASYIFSPLLDFIMQFTMIEAQESNVRALNDIIEEEEDPLFLLENEETDEKFKGYIEVKNLEFSYNTNLAPVIKDVSFRVEAGKSIAIVGGSGCGKSTLLKLIEGTIIPSNGSVYYDDVDIRNINRQLFKNSMAVVTQSTPLFNGTVRDLITASDKLIDMEDVMRVSKEAMIYDDIMKHPDGFNTMIKSNAPEFSGGQMQRLYIARALLKNPTILILEEATSALDTIVEDEIMNNIKKRNITLIIVAHRLSTIRDCDEIIVLDNGEIVERGRHDELIKVKDGKYYQFINSENEE